MYIFYQKNKCVSWKYSFTLQRSPWFTLQTLFRGHFSFVNKIEFVFIILQKVILFPYFVIVACNFFVRKKCIFFWKFRIFKLHFKMLNSEVLKLIKEKLYIGSFIFMIRHKSSSSCLSSIEGWTTSRLFWHLRLLL